MSRKAIIAIVATSGALAAGTFAALAILGYFLTLYEIETETDARYMREYDTRNSSSSI